MTFRGLLVVLAASALGACAGPKAATPKPGDDGFFTMKFTDAKPADVDLEPGSDSERASAYSIELSFERADGRRIAAPRASAYSGQTARIAIGNRPSADGSQGDDAAKRIQDGVRLDVCAQRADDGGVSFGYRVRVAKSKAPADAASSGESSADGRPPSCESVEFAGARRLEPGVQGMLGRITSPDGSGPMLVLARVTPIRVDAPPAGVSDDAAFDATLKRAMSGRMLHLRVTAVEIPREFEPGAVIDETATPDMMKSLSGRILRDFEIFTCVDSRVRIAGSLESGDASNGLVATGRDDGSLELTWTSNGVARTASVRPSAGRRFVALAGIEGGGTAGVLVAVDAD